MAPPPYRPNEKAVRDALRAALKHHQLDATTAARVIVERIAPGLPEAARADLLRGWQENDDQINYLAEKWLRCSR
jgi:hypothetical protein